MNFFKKALSPTLTFLICIVLSACSADVPMELPSSGTAPRITATSTEGSTTTATTITEEMSTTAFEIETTVTTSTKAPAQTSFSSIVQTTSTTIAPTTTTKATVQHTEASHVAASEDRYPPEDKRQFSVYFNGETVSLTFSKVTTDTYPLEYAYWNYTGTLSTGQTVSCRVVNTTGCITHISADYVLDSGFIKKEDVRTFLREEFQTMGFAFADEDIDVQIMASGTQTRANFARISVSSGEGEYFVINAQKSGGQLRLCGLTVYDDSGNLPVECNKNTHAYLTPAWA